MSAPSTTAGGAAPPADDALDRAVWMVAIVVVLGALMSILDTTVVNVAINTLARDFETPLTTIQWVATGYTLALATVIPLTGWGADRFGTKRLYMTSITLFVLGSVLSGLAWSSGSLIAFRILQGFGGGMLMPAGMTILTRAAGPQPRRARHGRHRRPDDARPDLRPRPRRLARRQRVLALDLLHQRPRRPRRLHHGAAGPAPGRPLAVRAPRRVGLCCSSPSLAAIIFGLAKSGEKSGFGHAIVIVPVVSARSGSPPSSGTRRATRRRRCSTCASSRTGSSRRPWASRP